MDFCKRLLAVLLAVVLMAPATALAAYQPTFDLQSQAAYLENLDTGQVMVEKNADQRMFPGYLTKVMTALVVLDHMRDHNLDLDTESTALKLYIQDMVYGSRYLANIYNGDELSIRDLLYAMMLQSANEATLMLADYVGDGSLGRFVDLMNQKAKELGCTNTNFTDAVGFEDPDTYTTARDLSKITAAAMAYPEFQEIVSSTTRNIQVLNKTQRSITLFGTTNGLINRAGSYYLAAAKGGMSSSLAAGGRSMVSQAASGGYTYQAVVLGAPLDKPDGTPEPDPLHYIESRKLYLWAFENFSVRTVVDRGELVSECPVRYSMNGDFVKVETGGKLTALMENNLELSSVQYQVELPDWVAAPVERGQQLGTLRLVLAEEELGTVPLLAAESLPASRLLVTLGFLENLLHSYWAKVAVVLVVLLTLGYSWLLAQARRRKQKAKRRASYHL